MDVNDAIRQCVVHCRLIEEQQYEMLSTRGVLYTLGFTPDEADEVIRTCADRGFSRGIDPMIESTYFSPNDRRAVNDMVTEFPRPDDCYWGVDQLRSRLESVAR